MPAHDDILSFEAETYTVERQFFRQSFRVTGDGDRVLRTERTVAEGEAIFPFRDEDDETVFRVRSRRTPDGGSDYVLVVDGVDEPLLVLSNDIGFRRHRWTIERPDGEELAEVTPGRGLVGALHTVVQVFSPFPQTFTVTAPNGERRGEIRGRLGLRRVSDVNIGSSGEVPRSTLVAGAIAITVLESV